MDRKTPNYILVEETKMIELRIEAMRRVIKYEKGARNSDKKIVIECIKDLEKERKEGEESKWEATRRTLLKRIGMEKEELKKKREEGNQEIVKIILKKIWRKKKEERQKKINESRYNNMCKDIITEDLPKYLGEEEKKG